MVTSIGALSVPGETTVYLDYKTISSISRGEFITISKEIASNSCISRVVNHPSQLNKIGPENTRFSLGLTHNMFIRTENGEKKQLVTK
jgi:hypothetical protein